ncbi:MAG: hypothetical protein QME51_05495 [Planctomycetota bacterium]|nr:hypothetical protein [Planctomycetota bacterium]MDI6787806.1 hypothetical protein [Planctomycetota bacterium]
MSRRKGVIRYSPGSEGLFGEGSDAYEALKRGRQVTLDDRGSIVDVWDPTTKKLYDVLGNEIGSRDKEYELGKMPEYRKQRTRTPKEHRERRRKRAVKPPVSRGIVMPPK